MVKTWLEEILHDLPCVFHGELADIVKANECISLYKSFSSENVLAMIDTKEKKQDNLL